MHFFFFINIILQIKILETLSLLLLLNVYVQPELLTFMHFFFFINIILQIKILETLIYIIVLKIS